MRANVQRSLITLKPKGADPYWANVVLLLDASARANGSTPSDIDVLGKTATWRSNAQCKTDQAIFGSSSMYFDGDNDRLAINDSDDWAMGLGDFTFEAWVRLGTLAFTQNRVLVGQSNVYNGFYPFSIRITSSGGLQGAVTDGSSVYEGYSTAGIISVDNWYHIAMVRSGANLFGYCNGVRYTLRNDIGACNCVNVAGNLAVGSYSDFDAVMEKMLGHMDQVRITKGVARYVDSTIVVPTDIFPHG